MIHFGRRYHDAIDRRSPGKTRRSLKSPLPRYLFLLFFHQHRPFPVEVKDCFSVHGFSSVSGNDYPQLFFRSIVVIGTLVMKHDYRIRAGVYLFTVMEVLLLRNIAGIIQNRPLHLASKDYRNLEK